MWQKSYTLYKVYHVFQIKNSLQKGRGLWSAAERCGKGDRGGWLIRSRAGRSPAAAEAIFMADHAERVLTGSAD